MHRWPALLAFAFCACSGEGLVTRIELMPGPRAWAFLYFLDRAGEAIRRSDLVEIEDSIIVAGEARYELQEAEHSLLIVRLERAYLDSFRGFDVERASEIDILQGAECAEIERSQRDLKAPLPASTVVEQVFFAGDEAPAAVPIESFTFLTESRVRIPVIEDRCRFDGTRRLSAFGSKGRLFEGAQGFGGFDVSQSPERRRPMTRFAEVRRLEDGSVLGLTRLAIFHLRPGEPYVDAPGRVVSFADQNAGLTTILMDHRRAEGELLLAGHDRTGAGMIWHMRLGPQGLEAPRPTSARFDSLINGGIIDAQGRWILVGDSGFVLTGSSATGRFEEVARVPYELNDIVTTPDPLRPHLLLSNESVALLGDVTTNTLEELNVRDVSLSTVHLKAGALITESDEDTFLLSANVKSLIFSQDGASRAYPLELPSTLDNCLGESDSCGLSSLAEFPNQLVVIDDWAMFTLDDCPAILLARWREKCGTALGFDDVPIQKIDQLVLSAMDVADGILTIGGTEGALYQVDISGL